MTDAPRVLYVGGEGRSGTTLLDQILGQIPGVAGTGELFAIWEHGVLDNDRCGCGQPFADCPVWSAVGQEAFGGWNSAEARHLLDIRRNQVRDRYAPWLLRRRAWKSKAHEGERFVEALDALYRAIHAVTGASVIVDSSKFVGYAMVLARIPDIDLRVVQLVRDARGAAYSWTKTVEKPESTGRQEFMDRYPPVATASRWIKTDLLYLALQTRGIPLRTIRYEDLISDPAATIAEVAEFGCLSDSVDPLAMIDGNTVTLEPTHTVAGNPSRFRTGSVPLRLDEAWRTELPRMQRAIVAAVAAPSLARHGYFSRS